VGTAVAISAVCRIGDRLGAGGGLPEFFKAVDEYLKPGAPALPG
jgi:hypothetical protein